MYLHGQQSNARFIFSRRLLRVSVSLLLLLLLATITNIIFEGYAGHFYPLIKRSLGQVCHQDPSRTFSLSGLNMLVCARCTGIYTGAALISFIYVMVSGIKVPEIKYIFISSVPVILDVLFYNSGLYDYNKAVSFSTGLILGSVLFIYILPAIEKLIFGNE